MQVDKRTILATSNRSIREKRAWRITAVCDLLDAGKPDQDIVREQSAAWGCDRATVYKYIRSALDGMARTESRPKRKALRAYHYRQRKRIAELASRNGDTATALRALDSLARLQGMHTRSPEDDGMDHGGNT